MKKLMVSILLLLSSIPIFSCGYTPYGEDIRYCLLRPEYFQFEAYKLFYYNANQWGLNGYDEEKSIPEFYESNILDWYNFTQKKVALSAIETFNYQFKLTDIHPNSGNAFLDYLYHNKKSAVLQYLLFSKKCEDFNAQQNEDVWERNRVSNNFKRKQFYSRLYAQYQNERSDYLKRKYAFQCIRFSYYSGDMKSVTALFNEAFTHSKKDYIYYWSMYFTCFTTGTDNEVRVANLFAQSPEKAKAAFYYFHHDFDFKSALTQAHTAEDIASIYAYASCQKVDKNLDYLKIMYATKSNMRILDFMLLREINKVEDWIYTPYYSNYLPSIENSNYYWSDTHDKISTELLRNRSEHDRLYAQQLLDFVNTVDFSKVNNPVLWKAAQIQLLFMTRKYEACLSAIDSFGTTYSKEKVFVQIEQIKALCLTANQTYGKAILKDEVKPIFLRNREDSRFVFALGRELEFLGNLPDAMALISSINKRESEYSNYFYESYGVEWQGNRLKTTDNLSYFYEYFDYVDFVYSASELQVIVNKLNTPIVSDFDTKLYQFLLEDKNYLVDLLGTKYLRESQLENAQRVFRSLSQDYWDDNYNPWERNHFNEEMIFDANPFYSFKYTADFIPHKDKFRVTKLSVTSHLIAYLKKANNMNELDRDYYYFLVANCYFNMSESGNSWMMRRYQSSSSGFNEGYYDVSYVDEKEYRTKILAKKYYECALNLAKTTKFKALCMRMIDYVDKGYPDEFLKLKEAYPNYLTDLSNCDHLEEYFSARR